VGFCLVLVLRYGEVLIEASPTKTAQINTTNWSNWIAGVSALVMAIIIFCIEIVKPWWLKPRIIIEFNNEKPFCRHATVEGTTREQYYVRIRVKNKGKSVARRLRGKLVDAIGKDGVSHKDFDPLFLHWTTIEPPRGLDRLNYQLSVRYLEAIDLNRGEWDYLDVFIREKGKEELIEIATTKTPRACLKELHITDEIEYVKITIYGANVDPRTETYKLVWSGAKYDQIRMVPTK